MELLRGEHLGHHLARGVSVGDAVRIGREVALGLAAAHRIAVANTPVDSGSWRASHRVRQQGLRGEAYIDPSARNVRSKALVVTYSEALAKGRGGRYDVYRTVYQQQGDIAQAAARYVLQELP
jgi:hypothetical protein